MEQPSSNNSLIKQIRRCQSNILEIEPPDSNQQRVLHYIRKLSRLPITLLELETTGIGKTINSLRKINGSIGNEAALLVAKLKSIVKKQIRKDEMEQIHYSPSCSSELSVQNGSDHYTDLESSSSKKAGKKIHMITIKKHCSSYRKRKYSNEAQIDFEKNESSAERLQTVPTKASKTEKEYEDSTVTDFRNMDVKKVKYDDKKHERSYDEKKSSKIIKINQGSIVNDLRNADVRKAKYEGRKHKDTANKHHKSNGHRSKENKEHRRRRISSNSKISLEKHNEKKSKSPIKKHEIYSESKSNLQNPCSSNIYSSEPADDFGAALLSIPYSSFRPTRYKITSSASYTHSPSPLITCRSSSDCEPDLDDINMESIENVRSSDDFYSPECNNSQVFKFKSQDVKTEEEMFNFMTTTKNRRTKVFSGNKGYSNFKFPSLFELCVRILQNNFDALEYTGGVPYDVLKSILEKVSAQQLYTFENHNPYLVGETDELWEYHAKKEFKKSQPLNDETWRDVYLRCVEEREEKFQSVTGNISQSIANSTPTRKTKLAYIDSVVKPPRNVARSQAKYGTGNTPSKDLPKESQTASQSVKERLFKESMSPNAIQVPPKSCTLLRKKKAPLMQKTLQFLKGIKR